MDGDCAPVLRAAEHVADQVRLRSDLIVEIMRSEGLQLTACRKDRPRDARGPRAQRPPDRCARDEELGVLPRL